MTFDELSEWISQLGAGGNLSAATKNRIKAELPEFVRQLNPKSAPAKVRLPSGESLTNATRMTALKCQCLVLARTVSGAGFVKADVEYDSLAKDVLFFVMRHAFNSSDPKGVFCCPSCTLSLLPLYAAGCFRWVDCAELESNVLHALQTGTSVFKRTYHKAYADWAVNLARGTRSHDRTPSPPAPLRAH